MSFPPLQESELACEGVCLPGQVGMVVWGQGVRFLWGIVCTWDEELGYLSAFRHVLTVYMECRFDFFFWLKWSIILLSNNIHSPFTYTFFLECIVFKSFLKATF